MARPMSAKPRTFRRGPPVVGAQTSGAAKCAPNTCRKSRVPRRPRRRFDLVGSRSLCDCLGGRGRWSRRRSRLVRPLPGGFGQRGNLGEPRCCEHSLCCVRNPDRSSWQAMGGEAPPAVGPWAGCRSYRRRNADRVVSRVGLRVEPGHAVGLSQLRSTKTPGEAHTGFEPVPPP